VGKEFSSGTLKKFNSALKSLQNFIQWKFGATDFPKSKLSHQYIADYEFYLKPIQGIQHNTANWHYSKLSFNSRHCKIYCFDDLGAEQSLKYYGNECNVMGEVLLSRYDLFVSQNMITHLNTNLSASEIENGYGDRIRSRLREMFNLLAFEPKLCIRLC
jgi:hypothetical protein